ncbi:hypothetical protein [Sporosarcina gallistercoris]|uniref:t-SNARE coiled-coil homology domain-containing protein n=1 Tax=Sporosarcina gallistercoris TaxID=2762245 RepID=A0ABR8PIN6_9BACL|nr:hypothetical protein [Sporosarcina gallistercoris]MBD7908020.1 hypothetical protein [Sporosarcina gallistercoris]
MDKELITTLKSVLDDALQPIHRQLEGMDQRFDSIDQRFEGIDQKFDSIGQRFDGIDQKFDSIDQRFDGINQKFDSIGQRFDGMDKRFDGMNQRIGGLETELKEFRAETKTALQVIQSGQQGTRQEMTQRFNETREGFKRMEADFTYVNHKTADHELKFHRLESESKQNRQ